MTRRELLFDNAAEPGDQLRIFLGKTADGESAHMLIEVLAIDAPVFGLPTVDIKVQTIYSTEDEEETQ